jgi:hypothetical protein
VLAEPTDRLEARLITWAFGGKLPSGPISLDLTTGKSVQIRPVTAVDRERWHDDPPLISYLLREASLGCELQRVATTEELRDYRSAPNPALSDAYRVLELAPLSFRADQCIDLLKLIVDPKLGMAFSERFVQYQGYTNESNHVLSMNEFRAAQIGHAWSISASQARALAGHWRNLIEGPNATVVRFPLRRWSASTQRRWDEDRLIDCWIGLEGLFKRRNESLAIPEAIAPRVARLLGREQGVESVRLRNSYNIRNDITHGGIDYDEQDVEEAIETADEVLQASLRTLVDSAWRTDPKTF